MQTYALVDASGNIDNVVIWDGQAAYEPPADVTAVVVPPGETAFIGGSYTNAVFSPPVGAMIALSGAKDTQMAAMTAHCQLAIGGGFSSSALGSAHTYPSDGTTQRNIAMAAAVGGDLWCETGSSWALMAHTAAQAQQVQKDLFSMVQAKQAQYAKLLSEIEASTSVDAVQAIVWS